MSERRMKSPACRLLATANCSAAVCVAASSHAGVVVKVIVRRWWCLTRTGSAGPASSEVIVSVPEKCCRPVIVDAVQVA